MQIKKYISTAYQNLEKSLQMAFSPSIWMFLSNTGLTFLPPTRMPVVLQYRMFIPDFRLTWRQRQTW